MNHSKITGVRGEVLFTAGDPAKPWDNTVGYRYTADREDLSSEVLLTETFSRYDWAYQWSHSLPSRGHMTALAACFTFSSSENARSNLGAVAEFHVKW